MEIIVAEKSGFCFGVKRAIKTTYDTVRETEGAVATLGPLIHNPQVVSRLEELNVRSVRHISEFHGERLIIRSHGVPRSLIREAERRGITIVDATCPFVKNAQKYACSLKEEGYRVVIVGDKNHPEVQGIQAYAGGKALVAARVEDLERIEKVRKIGVVAQTTTSLETFKRVVDRCLEVAGEIKVFNTLCDATRIRQIEARKIARTVDLMLVVGGRNSGNTNRLAEICRKTGTRTYHIETAGELDLEWFHGVKKAGVTAGASTPDWIITELVEALKEIPEV